MSSDAVQYFVYNIMFPKGPIVSAIGPLANGEVLDMLRIYVLRFTSEGYISFLYVTVLLVLSSFPW